MKKYVKGQPGNQAHAAGNANLDSKPTLFLRSLFLLIFLLGSVFILQGQNTAKDPGPRAGAPGAGNFIAGLTSSQQTYFTDGQTRFQEV